MIDDTAVTREDYFDRVEQGLRQALRRGAQKPWYLRIRPRPGRALVVAFATLAVAGSALAAVGSFFTGSPVAADVPGTPHAFAGVAIASTVRLLSLRVADPAGGPPWGMRTFQTTRRLECVQVGRIVDGRVGVLGQDGVFGDDGRFHALPLDYSVGPSGCAARDGAGHAFTYEQAFAVPASGLFTGPVPATGGCYTPPALGRRPPCPPADLRDVEFGLLGPQAVSFTHRVARGRSATSATAGPDGAFLIVLDHARANCWGETPGPAGCGGVLAGGSAVALQGALVGIEYRGGGICGTRLALPSDTVCPPVGYVAPRNVRVTSAEVATPIHARLVRAKAFCGNELGHVEPCAAHVAPGYSRIASFHHRPQALVVVSFTARVAVHNGESYYRVSTSNPVNPRVADCTDYISEDSTQTDLRAGQTVQIDNLVDPRCTGTVRVHVSFVPTTGRGGLLFPAGTGVAVGHATLRIR